MLSVRHEIFLEVAAHLSFSKASQTLFISQPAISKHIKALEDFYKTILFERKGSTIVLSDAGKLLHRRLREAKHIQKQLEFELSTLKDQFLAKGQLKLGASTTVALYILPKILSSFHQKFPRRTDQPAQPQHRHHRKSPPRPGHRCGDRGRKETRYPPSCTSPL